MAAFLFLEVGEGAVWYRFAFRGRDARATVRMRRYQDV